MLTVVCRTCGSVHAVPLDGTFRWVQHHKDGRHTVHSVEQEPGGSRPGEWMGA